FQQRPRKKPLYLRINAFQWVLVGLVLILALYTGGQYLALRRVTSQYDKNQAIIKRLEVRFAPLKAKLERLHRLQALEKDMLDFLRERPALLEILRELAQRTPKDAWIKYFTLKNNVLRVSAEGGSAVNTMESWRKSRLFSSVKLASPVTKDRQGRERYTVELIIRSQVQQKGPKK
ncbi:MAG: PilN domain-containing protein, partial [Thermodesulfobacteria bacterium]|nr:PilN domain-containing protein [Thermodesulfobacteriota bacterium]